MNIDTLLLWFVLYTIPTLYLIYRAHKIKADDIAYILAIVPVINIILACYTFIKQNKLW